MRGHRRLFTAGRTAVLVVLVLHSGLRPVSGLAGSATPAAATEQAAHESYAELAPTFVPNEGQIDQRAAYYAQGAGFGFYFRPHEVVVSLSAAGGSDTTLALRFVDADPNPHIVGRSRAEGIFNYMIGPDPADWHTGLPTYSEVVYRQLWPGIDMVFRGDKGKLKYEFLVAPGADVTDIALAYRGAGGLALDRAGNLLIETPAGSLLDTAPVTYQIIEGRRRTIESAFALRANTAEYGFELGRYDPSLPLVIDPGLEYSGFLGGGQLDEGLGVAVDGEGNAYVTGSTQFDSGDPFPTTAGALDTTQEGADAFVTKINADGSALLYSTFLGGGAFDVAQGIAVDASGNAYVTGFSHNNFFFSPFPTTPGAFDPTGNDGLDAFVTKLSADGSALLYSTHLEAVSTAGTDVALDTDGNAYITGFTSNEDFPATPGAFDTTFNGGNDVFVTKLNPAGSDLVYSTFLGGASFDRPGGVAVDPLGNAYVTGSAFARGPSGFPTTPGAFDTTFNGHEDAFVTKLDPTGSALAYSTFLGGTGPFFIDDEGPTPGDRGEAVAVDATGHAYVTGLATSVDFPTTPGVFDTTPDGSDAFITKLNPTGSALDYSTVLGGTGGALGTGIALDPAGNAYVAGNTNSEDFPTTDGAFDTTYNGGGVDVFVTEMNPDGSALVGSTYLGGSDIDVADGVAADSSGAYVTGLTQAHGSSDFPTTPEAFETTHSVKPGFFDVDAFVAKLSFGSEVGPPASLTLSPEAAANTVDDTHCVTATVTDASGNPVPNVTVRFSVPTADATDADPSSGSLATGENGEATFCYSASLPGEDTIEAFADTDGDGEQETDEPADEANKTWVLPASTPGCKVSVSARIVASNDAPASAGGIAQVSADGSTTKGEQTYQDHGPAQRRTVKSIELIGTTCSEDAGGASIFGRATIDGGGSFTFRIDVTDSGSPVTPDTYGIALSDGYDSGQQPLRGGNVTIHT